MLTLIRKKPTNMLKYFVVNWVIFPSSIWRVPLHYEKLRRDDIQPVVDKVIDRIPGWQSRLLSYVARATLLKACLASVPIYLLSVIKFSKWAIKAINSQMANFF
jgi:hypothetical protein